MSFPLVGNLSSKKDCGQAAMTKIGRYFKVKYLTNVTSLQLSPEKCTGCGRCIDVCPHGVFIMNNKKASITDKDLCMECGACALNCEFGAVSVNSGVGCAAAIINSMITGGPPSCDCSGSPSQSASSNCC